MRTQPLADTERAIFEWVDNHYVSIMDAFEMAAERNEEMANGFVHEDKGVVYAHARALRDSASSWRRHAATLRDLYQQLPTEE